jgi:hypothetical protein
MNTQTMTTDTILERLQWIVDRQRYRRACNIIDGSAYAAECSAERDLLAELERRYNA